MPVDYAKLAAEHGGQAAAPPVDYAALAQQAGGSVATAGAAPRTYLEARLDPLRGRDDAGDLPPDTGAVTRWFETTLRPMLARVAHPETIDDIAALLIPNTGNLLAQAAPARAATAARAVGASTGRGLAATGRGIEAVATSKPIERISELGALGEALYRGDPVGGVAAYVAPKVAAVAGRGLQRAGAALERVAAIAPDVVPAGVGQVLQKAPTVNDAVIGALNDLRQAAPEAKTAARLPEYPQAAADTMRSLQARAPVTSARPPPARSSAPVAPTPAPPAQLGTPAIAPVASHTPAPPLRNLNDAPAVTVTPAQATAERVLQFNPSKVLADVKATFEKLGETPLRAEATNAMEYMRRGVSAEDAVQRVIARRAPTSAVEDLAARLKGPTDAAVHARVASRNASGRWTE